MVKWLHETAETNPSHRRHGHGGRCCRHFGGYVAALDAVEPYAESRECSDIGRNACPPEPLPRADSRDPELGRPVIEANPTEQALLPLGSPTLVPGTGNLTMQGYAPELRRALFDDTGMSAQTPLPLRMATAVAPDGRV